jgi:hypothetical protein
MGGDAYLANSDRLLSAHPELVDDLNAGRFESFVRARYLSSQLFASNNFLGSPAHLAVICTLFYQVEGSKKWTLIDPAFSYFTYPVTTPIDGYSGLLWMDEADAERCPLFQFCPRYEVSLVPGEVLFNPWYWPHAVVNLTPRSIGVAVRWTGMKLNQRLSSCSLFDLATSLNVGRMEHEVQAGLAMFSAEQSAWFEGNVHGRRYQYSPDTIAKSWGIKSPDYTLQPRFAGGPSTQEAAVAK